MFCHDRANQDDQKKPRECLREASVGLVNESRQLPVGIPVVGRNTVVQPLDFNCT